MFLFLHQDNTAQNEINDTRIKKKPTETVMLRIRRSRRKSSQQLRINRSMRTKFVPVEIVFAKSGQSGSNTKKEVDTFHSYDSTRSGKNLIATLVRQKKFLLMEKHRLEHGKKSMLKAILANSNKQDFDAKIFSNVILLSSPPTSKCFRTTH